MKIFLYIWDHVSDKHKIMSCLISFMMIVSAATLVPVPMTTGNVTTARWFYNIWDDHKRSEKAARAEHEKADEVARVAAIDRDLSSVKEARDGRSLITMQLKLQALQNDRTHTENTSVYDKEEKSQRVRRINDRLDRLYEEMNRKNIKLDDLQSFNDNQVMLAYKL